MFDCGIDIIINELQTQFENDCLKAVQAYGFNIDKYQLKKAITDSKSFYDEGYLDAKRKFERPHGDWIKEEKVFGGFGDSILVNTCSLCHESFVYHGSDALFCPNCGADMREREN